MKRLLLVLLLVASCSAQEVITARRRAAAAPGSFSLLSSNTSVCFDASAGTHTCSLASAASSGKLIIVGAEAVGTDVLTCSLDVSGAMTKQETSQYNFSTFNGQEFYKVATGADVTVSCPGYSGPGRIFISSFNVPGGFGGSIIASTHTDYTFDGTTVESGSYSIPGSGSALTVGLLWGLGNDLTPAAGWSCAFVGWSSGACTVGAESYGGLVYKVDTLGGTTNAQATQTNTGSGRIGMALTIQ
jgi:hypothetical protein